VLCSPRYCPGVGIHLKQQRERNFPLEVAKAAEMLHPCAEILHVDVFVKYDDGSGIKPRMFQSKIGKVINPYTLWLLNIAMENHHF